MKTIKKTQYKVIRKVVNHLDSNGRIIGEVTMYERVKV